MHSSCKCYFIIIATQRRMQFLHAPSLRIDIITNENLLSYHREEDNGEACGARLCNKVDLASHTVVLFLVACRRLYEQHLWVAHDEELAGCLDVMFFCEDGACVGHMVGVFMDLQS